MNTDPDIHLHMNSTPLLGPTRGKGHRRFPNSDSRSVRFACRFFSLFSPTSEPVLRIILYWIVDLPMFMIQSSKRSPQGRYTVGRLLNMPANKNINLYHVTKLSLNTSRWLFIIYLHKGSYACFIHKNHFGPLLSDYFFIWEIVDLNLTSRVRSLVNVTPNLSIKANWSFLKTTFTAFCYIPGQKLLKRKKTHQYN